MTSSFYQFLLLLGIGFAASVSYQFNDSVVVFSVGRTHVLYQGADHVPFDKVLIDTADGFDASMTVYTVPQSGLYLTHFSAGVLPFTAVVLALNGTTNTPNVLMTYSGYTGDITVSRDDLQYWSKGQEVWLSSSNSLSGDGYYPTSWSAVRLDNIMTSTVAFTLARTSDYTVTSGSDLAFTDVMVTVGSSMTTCQNQFVAPKAGIYFLSFSVGVRDTYSTSSRIYMYLRVNGNTVGSLYIDGIDHKFDDISSNCQLATLAAGNIVTLYHNTYDAYFHYSDNHYQTALTGFLYEPQHGMTIAWHITHSTNEEYNGPITAFPFNLAFVNVGGAWQASDSAVIIPVSGIYWLKISGMSSGTSTQLNMILSVNGQSIISVVEKITNNGFNTRSHAIAYHLNAGDRLVVSIPTGFILYTWQNSASFSGFLIYPD